jgi:hypothetical protein
VANGVVDSAKSIVGEILAVFGIHDGGFTGNNALSLNMREGLGGMVMGASFLFLSMTVMKGLSCWLMLALRHLAQVRLLVRFPQISRAFCSHGVVGVITLGVAGGAVGVALLAGLLCGLLWGTVVSC